jgi:selenocysteine-specific elongation factor
VQVIATAGHVDHGKSTLVRALTGMEPDRYAEERRRGMTIDLGFAWTELPGDGGTLAFVDVPGHERFVTTMLAGVGPVPAVMLVVAADEGWMPQSREHLDALTALGVRHGLLVVTRTDLMAADLAVAEAREHLAGTPLATIAAVGVSAHTGEGLDELRAALTELAVTLPAADHRADLRLWIDRAFTIRGAGTVVTGTLAGGRIRVDDELQLSCADGSVRTVAVRGLQSLGRTVTDARGVARIAVNLRGVPREAVARGDVLLTRGAWLTTEVVDVRLHGLRALPGDEPDGSHLPAQLSVHVGSVAVPVRLRPLGADTVRLQLARPLPLRIGDRLVLRDPGRRQVSAGATVLDVRPPALRRRGAAAARAAQLAEVDGVASASGELARRGVARRADLVAMGVPAADLDALAHAGTPSAAGWMIDADQAGTLAERLAAAVTAHDAADPLDPGLPTEAARRAVDLPDARLLDAVLRHAHRAGVPGPAAELVLREGRVARGAAAGAGRPARRPPVPPVRRPRGRPAH